jgi:hypothetical protein
MAVWRSTTAGSTRRNLFRCPHQTRPNFRAARFGWPARPDARRHFDMV